MSASKPEASRMSRVATKLSETAEGRHVLLQQVLTGEGLSGLIALRRIERMLEAGASADELGRVVAAAFTDIVSPLPAGTVRGWLDAMITRPSSPTESAEE
jgi:hypothetical protein